MRKAIFAALAAVVVGSALGSEPAEPDSGHYYEVVGVKGDDMLKMRAGPGVGYRIIVGLPNGTVLRVYDCDQIGSKEWCEVSLKEFRGLKGYVSWHYLREL